MFISELPTETQDSLGVGKPEGVDGVKFIRTPNDITFIGKKGVLRLLGNTHVAEALRKPETMSRLTAMYGPSAAKKLKPRGQAHS